MLAFLASIVLPIVFVFSLIYAVKFLMEDSFYAFVCGALASGSLILILYWLVDHIA